MAPPQVMSQVVSKNNCNYFKNLMGGAFIVDGEFKNKICFCDVATME